MSFDLTCMYNVGELVSDLDRTVIIHTTKETASRRMQGCTAGSIIVLGILFVCIDGWI